MIDPATIAAGAIAKIAFDEFVKSGAGEVAKQTVGGAVELVKALRDRIKAKLEGNERATAALTEVERDGSEAALEKVGKSSGGLPSAERVKQYRIKDCIDFINHTPHFPRITH
jgi:hypothetical protein